MTDRISANDVLRFVLELVALISLGAWGLGTQLPMLWRVVLGIGTPVLAALLWGAFISPKARFQLPAALKSFLEVAIFAAAATALFALHRPVLGSAFVGLVVVHELARWNYRR